MLQPLSCRFQDVDRILPQYELGTPRDKTSHAAVCAKNLFLLLPFQSLMRIKSQLCYITTLLFIYLF